jgi:hypothetical protein
MGSIVGRDEQASIRDCHLLRDFQHFGHAVPVTASSGGPQRPLNGCPRKFRSALAIGKVDIGFAANEMHLFRANLDGQCLFPGLLAGIVCKKVHNQPAGLDAAAFGERVARDHLLQFGGGAQHHAGAEAVGLFNGVLYSPGKFGQVFFAATKDDVAALDISLRVFEFERDAERLEGVHLDHIAAADVHAAEHANDYRHRRKEYRP